LRGQKIPREKFAETKFNEQTFGEVRFVLRGVFAILPLSPLLFEVQGFLFFSLFSFSPFSLPKSMAVVGFYRRQCLRLWWQSIFFGTGR
jgi:hypothetical protein